MDTVIFTIGHSTRSLEEFIALLKAHGVTMLADVRTIPRSRRNPQFNEETLPQALQAAGIAYVHVVKLGGLRYSRLDSVNTGWRNTSFRGFADYMQTHEFDEGLDQLMALAENQVVAIMCAESLPWRCHRLLISDALVLRGYDVENISRGATLTPHVVTPWAHVDGLRITYPPHAGQDAGSDEAE